MDIRSAEVGFNFKDDTLNSLPLERTYRGLFQLIPGVADNRSPVGPAAGGSRQDNLYLIDGANITSPAFGYLSTEVNELDIAEVNIKRGGISAEFGRTAAPSSMRSAAAARIDSPAWVASTGCRSTWSAATSCRRSRERWRQAGSVPRPAADDRDDARRRGRRSDRPEPHVLLRVGALLARNEVGSVQQGRDAAARRGPDGPEFFGKLTFAPATAHQLTGSYRHRPNHVENAGTGADFAPTVATMTDNGSRIATAEWANFLAARQSVNVRYLYMKENNEDIPITDLGYLPTFDPRNLAAMGQYTDPSQANLTVGGSQFANIQNYQRHEVRGTFSQFFDIGRTSHTLKAGVGYEFARGDSSTAPPTAGARSSTSRRAACRRCARGTSRRRRRSSAGRTPTRCSFRTT